MNPINEQYCITQRTIIANKVVCFLNHKILYKKKILRKLNKITGKAFNFTNF